MLLDDVILPLLSAGSGIGLEWLMHLEREQGLQIATYQSHVIMT